MRRAGAGAREARGGLPVVIAGAGPTGLMAAILLAHHGVHSIVLERRAYPYRLPRAVHLDDEGCRILQAAGVAEPFLQISRPALGLRLLDARHHTMAEFRRSACAGPNGYPQANMFDQPELEALLRARAAEFSQIEMRTGWQLASLTAEGPSVTAVDAGHNLQHIAASAVLGCDGAASTVRGLIGAGLRDLHFRERWLVVDARSHRQLGWWDGVHQVCDPVRAATYMQVGPDRYRWEFRLGPDEQAAVLGAPRSLGRMLQPWTGQDGLSGLEIIRSSEYTFRAQLASPWRRGPVFLLGDAAHQTPPFIGQGLAAGLRDAANLAWKLAMVLSGEADDALLDSYQAERSPHAEALIRKAVLLGWAMTGGQDRVARLRRLGLAALVRIPGMTTGVLDRRTALPLHRGELVARGALPGRLIPQPVVIQGGQQRLLDDVLGPGFSIVTLAPLNQQLARFATQLSAKVVYLHQNCSSKGVCDPVHPLIRWLRRAGAQAVVLRPDRVVLAACGPDGQLRGAQLRATIRAAQLLTPRSDRLQQG